MRKALTTIAAIALLLAFSTTTFAADRWVKAYEFKGNRSTTTKRFEVYRPWAIEWQIRGTDDQWCSMWLDRSDSMLSRIMKSAGNDHGIYYPTSTGTYTIDIIGDTNYWIIVWVKN